MIACLDTIKHKTQDELLEKICEIVDAKSARRIVLGLPLRPDGSVGEQAMYVQEFAKILEQRIRMPIEFVDERYTSYVSDHPQDRDATAACSMLHIALERPKK